MNHPAEGREVQAVALATADDMRARIRSKSRLKGRQTDEVSLEEVRLLIGPRPATGHRRDLLIEQLHKLNDTYRCLHDRHLVALAREMNFSESTFVFPPIEAGASTRVRIFTTTRELPVAGHPTGEVWAGGARQRD